MTIETNLIAGLDIGNGYFKGRMAAPGDKPANVDMPSAVRKVTVSHNVEVQADDVPAEIENLYNRLDASFASPLIETTKRHLFGKRGVEFKNGFLLEFKVDANHDSKADNELTFLLALGSIAAKTLQDYYRDNNALPAAGDVLSVTVRAALALPITEYQQYRREFRSKFMGAAHVVTIHNFLNPIVVQIQFADVQVMAEGEAAQLAIQDGGVTLMNSLMNDLRKMESVMPGITERLEEITPEALLGAERSVSVDIGEGTVNFPVMGANHLDNDLSDTMNRGYGIVLNEALARIQRKHLGINSRKALTEYLNSGMKPSNRKMYELIQSIVDEHLDGFASDVAEQFADVMSNVGVITDVVYVYGGGATALRPVLYPALLKTYEKFGGIDMAPPILYLDSRYSRNLNRNGLYIYAERTAKAASAGEVPAAD